MDPHLQVIVALARSLSARNAEHDWRARDGERRRGVEPVLELHDLESAGPDCCFRIARRLAATEGAGPKEPVGGLLDEPERRVAGSHVFPEAELATGG
jgi:hypothetical protein